MTDASRERSMARSATPHLRTTVRRPRSFPPPVRGEPAAAPAAAPADPRTDSLIERYPVAPAVTITHERSITGDLADRMWKAYHESVGPLAEVAVLKHLDTLEDMLGQFANPRILKLVAWQGREPIGLGMVTNSLEDVAEISPEFLRAKYPDFAARDAIYVGMLVLVSPSVRGMTAFNRIYTELWQVPAREGGILVFDVCEFNRVTFAVDELARRIATNFPRASIDMLDRQTWYVAHLPEPLPERSAR